ncbi:hypothetical protein [Psychrobacter sp. CAL346-MNA-CIBAN-0220]|uniref:hypothetical protein n=1 Tax=Psychrobacter sp. CAL346-MNA-CIBAN-0220 TaxID=3140457 RepID=UPI00332B8CC7
MEPVSIASFTLASILASLPANGVPVNKSTITTHISPAIAGQWEIDLNSTNTIGEPVAASADQSLVSNEPKIIAGTEGGVIAQNEQRIVKTKSNIKPNAAQTTSALGVKSAQCRELYNFGADNEMWAVSGKELTYGRYIVSHREEGLPIIAIKTIYDNNEPDCSGNQIDQTDEALIAFLNHDGNQMQWCADPNGKECFMNFNRVLP